MNATASSPARVDDDYVWDQGAGLPVMLQDVRTPSTGSASTTTYLYGLGLISETVGSTTHFYVADGLGSTTELVEDDGDVANAYRYDVWGALRSSSGSVANQFDFTGEQADHNANRGLVYLRARHYDPALGRFLSRDPLPMTQRYAYVGNQPTFLVDPFGLFGFKDIKGAAKSVAKRVYKEVKTFVEPALTLNCLDAVVGIGALSVEALAPVSAPAVETGLAAFRASVTYRQAADVLVGAGGMTLGVATNASQLQKGDRKEASNFENVVNAIGIPVSVAGGVGAFIQASPSPYVQRLGYGLSAGATIYSTLQCGQDILS